MDAKGRGNSNTKSSRMSSGILPSGKNSTSTDSSADMMEKRKRMWQGLLEDQLDRAGPSPSMAQTERTKYLCDMLARHVDAMQKPPKIPKRDRAGLAKLGISVENRPTKKSTDGVDRSSSGVLAPRKSSQERAAAARTKKSIPSKPVRTGQVQKPKTSTTAKSILPPPRRPPDVMPASTSSAKLMAHIKKEPHVEFAGNHRPGLKDPVFNDSYHDDSMDSDGEFTSHRRNTRQPVVVIDSDVSFSRSLHDLSRTEKTPEMRLKTFGTAGQFHVGNDDMMENFMRAGLLDEDAIIQSFAKLDVSNSDPAVSVVGDTAGSSQHSHTLPTASSSQISPGGDQETVTPLGAAEESLPPVNLPRDADGVIADVPDYAMEALATPATPPLDSSMEMDAVDDSQTSNENIPEPEFPTVPVPGVSDLASTASNLSPADALPDLIKVLDIVPEPDSDISLPETKENDDSVIAAMVTAPTVAQDEVTAVPVDRPRKPKKIVAPDEMAPAPKSEFDLLLERMLSDDVAVEDVADMMNSGLALLPKADIEEFSDGPDSETESEASQDDEAKEAEEEAFVEKLFTEANAVVQEENEESSIFSGQPEVLTSKKKTTKLAISEDPELLNLIQMAYDFPSESESDVDQEDRESPSPSSDREWDLNRDLRYGEGDYSDENDDGFPLEDLDPAEFLKEIQLEEADEPQPAKTHKKPILSSSESSASASDAESDNDGSVADSAITGDSAEATAEAEAFKFNDPNLDNLIAELLDDGAKENVEPITISSTEYESEDPDVPSTSAGIPRRKKKKNSKKRRSSSVDSGRSSRGSRRRQHKKPAPSKNSDSDSDVVRSPHKKRIKQELDSDSEGEKVKPVFTTQLDRKWDVITLDSSEDEVREVPRLIDLPAKKAAEARRKENAAKKGPMKKEKGPKIHVPMTDAELSNATRRAKEEEQGRMERVEVLPKFPGGLLDRSTAEDGMVVEVKVHEKLWTELHDHQIEGVRFLYNNVVETYGQLQGSRPNGCILAHSMGLGKTLQVIAFLQAILSTPEMDFRTCLVLCPATVVMNWMSEFEKWLGKVPKEDGFQTYVVKRADNGRQLTLRDNLDRLRRWKKNGGVVVMSYDLYRSYCSAVTAKPTENRLNRHEKESLLECLRDSGPDILVCDEAHSMKNRKSKLCEYVSEISTTARISLTGTPMQNNLKEYYTMVNFVKPYLLGKPNEFEKNYLKPITAGSRAESTKSQVSMMKKCSFRLKDTLSGCLLLRDSSVLLNDLPPKHEYLITVRPLPNQVQLYEALIDYALDLQSQREIDREQRGKGQGRAGNNVLSIHRTMQLVTTHPRCLQLAKDEEIGKIKRQRDLRRQQLKEFGGSGAEDSEDDADGPIVPWFGQHIPTSEELDYRQGNKTIMIRTIILQALSVGDKVLIFSERMPVLSVLEELLQSIHKEKLTTTPTSGKLIEFRANINYLQIDGGTSQDDRQRKITRFNRDPGCTVFLLSIRSAGMGINLVGANRVILIEPMWNPTVDKQALFRTYRYGQAKPVYVYRFMTYGTIEQVMGEAQLNKDLLFNRVTSEKHGKRRSELIQTQFMEFEESPYDQAKPFVPLNPPKDACLRELLQKHPELIVETHDYDSLLEATEPALNHEESVLAWAEDYLEQDKDAPWAGGNPFAALIVDREVLAKELKEKKCCSFDVKARDLQNLYSYVNALCDHMPRGSRTNLHAIIKKLGQDLGKIRVVTEEIKRQKAIQDEVDRVKEYQRQQKKQHEHLRRMQQNQQRQTANTTYAHMPASLPTRPGGPAPPIMHINAPQKASQASQSQGPAPPFRGNAAPSMSPSSNRAPFHPNFAANDNGSLHQPYYVSVDQERLKAQSTQQYREEQSAAVNSMLTGGQTASPERQRNVNLLEGLLAQREALEGRPFLNPSPNRTHYGPP